MNRREALATAGGFAALTAFSALAADAKAAPAPKAPAAAAPAEANPYAAAIKAADHCLETGRDCVEMCVRILSTGDKMMAECMGTVRAMMPMCEALTTLARMNSPHTKALAAVCAKVCRDCEASCKKHAQHHAECKACMESCAACATECEKLAA